MWLLIKKWYWARRTKRALAGLKAKGIQPLMAAEELYKLTRDK